jgi:hypothetical protein
MFEQQLRHNILHLRARCVAGTNTASCAPGARYDKQVNILKKKLSEVETPTLALTAGLFKSARVAAMIGPSMKQSAGKDVR